MNKLKIFTGASIMSAILLSSVAFAATTDISGTTNDIKTTTPPAHVPSKLTATQKACVKTASVSKATAIKAAKSAYTQALKDAKTLATVQAKKDAKTAAKKAYKDALISAKNDYKAAKADCMK